MTLATILMAACGQKTNTTSETQKMIVSGEKWLDTDGNMINAHGGGILYHEGTYYWYGEYKGDSTYWNPKVPSWECYRTEAGGVSCYSSTNLVDWKFEGVVLPSDQYWNVRKSFITIRLKNSSCGCTSIVTTMQKLQPELQ